MQLIHRIVLLALTTALTYGCAQNTHNTPAQTAPSSSEHAVIAQLITSHGTIELELNKKASPLTVENFVQYAQTGHFNGLIFHRVIPGFMIQGGGHTPSFEEKSTQEPIKNEAANGLRNLRGTVSMARTNIVDSATSQFFINLVDNTRLDHQDAQKYGYAVFGKVVKGMDVADAIGNTPTLCPSQKRKGPCTEDLPPGMMDVPKTPVIIEKVIILN